MTVYAGWQLAVLIATGSKIASFSGSSTGMITLDGIQQITCEEVNRIEAKEETGQRTASALVEGTVGITGVIERFYTGSGINQYGFSNTLTGSALVPAGSTGWGILICPNGFNVAGNPWELVSDVKFDTRRASQRPGSNLLTESIGYVARYKQTGSF